MFDSSQALKTQCGLRTVGEYIAQSKPHRQHEWIVDGLLAPGQVSIMGSQPKDGKSTFGRCLVRQVARGEPFLGRATRRIPCIFFCLHRHERVTLDHFYQLGVNLDDNIKIAWEPLTASFQEDLDALRVLLQRIGPALVVIDPLSEYFMSRRGEALVRFPQVCGRINQFREVIRHAGAHGLILHELKKKSGILTGFLGITRPFEVFDCIMTITLVRNRCRRLDSMNRVGATPFHDVPLDYLSDGSLRVSTKVAASPKAISAL